MKSCNKNIIMVGIKTLCASHIALIFGLFTSLALSSNDDSTGKPYLDFRMHSLNLENQKERPKTPSAKKYEFRVVLDPGHGGKDLGAQGFFSVSEKNVALSLGKQVQREIEKTSKLDPEAPTIDVLLTREGDTFLSLKDRVTKANNVGADLFVSLHANSSPFSKVRGFEVYFLNAEATDEHATKLARFENSGLPDPSKGDLYSILSDVQTNLHVNESSSFAESVFSSMATRAITQARSVRQGPFTVLHGTTMPAILIEVGYVTNVQDALNLSKESYLKRLAGAISSGIFEFVLKQKRIHEIRTINAHPTRWPKTQRTSSPQNNPSLSQPSGG